MNPQDFVDRFLLAARACEKATGVPAVVSLAQAALESGWGNKCGGYAMFGIKADASWKAANKPIVFQNTQEVIGGKRILFTIKNDPAGKYRAFRAYATPEEAFIDHAIFLRQQPRYRACFACGNNSRAWARALMDAGYSTDHTTTDGTPTYEQALDAVEHSVERRMHA